MEIADRVIQVPLAKKHQIETRPRFTYLRRRIYNALALAGGDFVALSISVWIATALHGWWFGVSTAPLWSFYLLPAWYCGAALLHLLPSWGLGPVEELRRLTILLGIVFSSTAAALWLSRLTLDTEHITLLVTLLISAFTVPLLRMRIKRVLSAENWWGVPVVVYGGGHVALQIIRLLQRERGLGYTPIGVFDDDVFLHGQTLAGVPVLGETRDVHHDAPVAVLAMPSVGRKRSIQLLEGSLADYSTVIVIPNLIDAPSLWVKPRDLQGVLGLEISCNLCSPMSRFIKRSFEVLLVVLAAPLWLPLCAFIAAFIWLEDRHSPFFLQERVGSRGHRFNTWKFRTMAPNAEALLERALASDYQLREEWATSFKLKRDPRVTRVGRILRHLSLDEIPQLWNVLRGDMSLVGPRPLPPYHHQELPERVQDLRERVRPGITGLWQVSGRSNSGNKGMEIWDPYYVRNWSLWLDAIILIRTVRTVITGAGAY